MDGLQPDTQGRVAVLKDGPDFDGKGLPAGVALPHTRAAALTSQPPDLVARGMAMGADRPQGPQPSLYVVVGGGFVMEVGGGKNGRHGCAS